MRDNWFGTVTNENIEEIANKIFDMLKGKTYTFVEVYEYMRYEPKTRTSQKLENGTNGSPLSVWHSEDLTYSGANFCDTYGVWGISPNYYIVFEYNSITIHLNTPAGKEAYWQITVND